MKKGVSILLIVSMVWIVFNSNKRMKTNVPPADDLKGNITITGAFALYPLAVKWAGEFKKIHPNVRIDVSAGGAGKGITDVLSNVSDIGLLSRELNPEENKKGAFPITVARDAVVPTVSAKNPILFDLLVKGIKKDALNHLFIVGDYKYWEQATGIKTNMPLHVYTRSDAAGAAETWAKYFGKKQEDLLGIGVYGDPGQAQAIKKDPAAIGFSNIVYVYDLKTKEQTNGLIVLPIDLNNNGRIDPSENFYRRMDDLIAAIAAEKYPCPPARDLFFVTKGKPTDKITVEFIKYVLTQGQQFVHESGYINLTEKKLKEELINMIK
ncbi:MAG TPA: substrate-binding domain-containing protein [Bacteroidia bacterium]|jgi:phosphate transport system substrate-binding protein|nr:substrate-binding domain-containing protein [Bacteroidia bacterium]